MRCQGNDLTRDPAKLLVYTNYEILSSEYVDFDRLLSRPKLAHEIHEWRENPLRHPPDLLVVHAIRPKGVRAAAQCQAHPAAHAPLREAPQPPPSGAASLRGWVGAGAT